MAILISTPEDLDNIRNDVEADYILTNDIDMAEWGNFTPIGDPDNRYRFYGSLDGNGYVIRNLTVINDGSVSWLYSGLFNTLLSSSVIKNLGLEDVYVESNTHYLGGLAGNALGTISNCYVTGTIKQTGNTSMYNGGLTGSSNGLIENCYTDCVISGGRRTGGIFGYGASNGSINNHNYSKSRVSGSSDVGGYYGYINTNSGYTPRFTNCYFDSDVAGTTNYTRVGVTARTTEQMKQQTTYSRWDFDNVWEMVGDYPTLRIFSNIPSAKQETFLLESFINPIVSKSDRQAKSKKQIQSHIDSILSNTQRHTATLRNIHTYISNINTSVTQSHRSVRASTAQVNAFIKPIYTMVERKVNRTQSITSHINPLWSSTSVLIPLSNEVVNAYLSWLQNPSRTSYSENKSQLQFIENPTLLEVEE